MIFNHNRIKNLSNKIQEYICLGSCFIPLLEALGFNVDRTAGAEYEKEKLLAGDDDHTFEDLESILSQDEVRALVTLMC